MRMLTRVIPSLSVVRHILIQQVKRNIGVTAAVSQKANLDPIQQLFVEKVREYANKSKAAGGKLVDATPQVQQKLQEDLEKIDRMYSAKGEDMTKFPVFNFTDPDLQAVGLGEVRDLTPQVSEDQLEEKSDDDNKPYFEL